MRERGGEGETDTERERTSALQVSPAGPAGQDQLRNRFYIAVK